MENSSESISGSIISFIVITILVFVLIAGIYYLNQLRLGKTLTSSQINTLLVFFIIAAIIGFIIWIMILYHMFTGNHEHHGEVITHYHHDEMNIPNNENLTSSSHQSYSSNSPVAPHQVAQPGTALSSSAAPTPTSSNTHTFYVPNSGIPISDNYQKGNSFSPVTYPNISQVPISQVPISQVPKY